MPEKTTIVDITEIRGQDGSSAYHIHGGHNGKPADMIVSKEALHQLEKEGGHQAVDAYLKRALPGFTEGQKYPE